MVLVKAFAVGIVTAVLAPVVVMVGQFVIAEVTLFSRASAAGGGFVGISADIGFASVSGLLFTLAVGFALGFLFMLWKAWVRRHVQ
jgi:hypothetical protein